MNVTTCQVATIPTRLCGQRLAGPVLHLRETTSTNDVVAELARQGHPEGTVVVADFQSAGRGRRGRTWTSAPGSGLLCSILLRPRMVPSAVGLLTGCGGLAVAEALQALGANDVRTKWPNDVLLGGQKVAGVLVEAHLPEFAVVGIGVNLRGSIPQLGPISLPATNVEVACGILLERQTTLISIFQALDHWYGLLSQGETSRVLTAWRGLDVTRGWRAFLTKQDVVTEFTVIGISDTGGLLVSNASGLHELIAGDITLVQPLPSETAP